MAAVPERYFYILDLDTGEPLVVLPTDHLRSDYEIERYAAALRRTHRIDDPRTRLALVDARTDPLDPKVLRAKLDEG